MTWTLVFQITVLTVVGVLAFAAVVDVLRK